MFFSFFLSKIGIDNSITLLMLFYPVKTKIVTSAVKNIHLDWKHAGLVIKSHVDYGTSLEICTT